MLAIKNKKIKMRITFYLDVPYVCCFVQHFEPRGRSFTSVYYYPLIIITNKIGMFWYFLFCFSFAVVAYWLTEQQTTAV